MRCLQASTVTPGAELSPLLMTPLLPRLWADAPASAPSACTQPAALKASATAAGSCGCADLSSWQALSWIVWADTRSRCPCYNSLFPAYSDG